MTLDDELEFTPSNLLTISNEIEDLRRKILFVVDEAGADPIAEEFYLAALEYMNLSIRHLNLARLAQVRALGVKK